MSEAESYAKYIHDAEECIKDLEEQIPIVKSVASESFEELA